MGIVLLDEQGRIPRSIGDRLIMRSRIAGRFFKNIGFFEGSREAAVEVLRQDHVLGLVPGGMREALRASSDKYRVEWRGRMGFVWASMLSGKPIVLGACPRADDIYDVADLAITRRVYEKYKVPFALIRGIGPTVVPRPVKLHHLLSEPILPNVPPDRVKEEDVVAHHAALAARMDRLMKDALDLPPI
jgi:hypothetical protein